MSTAIFFLLAFSQPILPEFPPPLDLEPPTDKPLVIPLENDTIGVGIDLGSPFGLDIAARQDGGLVSYRAYLSLHERNDYYEGVERMLKGALKGVIGKFQTGASVDARSYSSAEEKFFSDAILFGFWHHTNTLAGFELQRYESTMNNDDISGYALNARFFLDKSWAKALIKNATFIRQGSFETYVDGFMQYQLGFILLTPNLQARVLTSEKNPLGAGAGLNLIAVIGNFTLGLDGRYKYATPVILDTFLLNPVNAGISDAAKSRLLEDRLGLILGYRGVEIEGFVSRGEGFFWQRDGTMPYPLLTLVPYTLAGVEARTKLERENVSSTGIVRINLYQDGTVWTPPWLLSDSLTVRFNSIGGFGIIKTSGPRVCAFEEIGPSVELDAGLFYEREPFRVVLRADDLLDSRPQIWPGVLPSGRRLSLSLTLFSSEW